jgi:branched-chain amino acid transport system substrate-binding protein
MREWLKVSAAALAAGAFGVGAAFAQTQGVTKDEIVIGTIQDLSGPIAGFGKQARNGLQFAVDEINAKGGVGGRKLKLIVEDNAYDPRKALLAAQKLVNSDKIFAMIGHIGTAQNMAAMPIQFEKNVINFMPLSGAREMFEPFHKLKFSASPPYYDQLRTLMPEIVKEKKLSRGCVLYQDDEFGEEVLKGGEDGLKDIGMSYVERASYKRGATDFSSQVAKLKAANCDLVVMGTIIRETVGVLGEAKKIGFNPVFFGSTASYTHLIHALGKELTNGFYSANTIAHPYLDDANPAIRDWAAKYKAKFNEDPTVFSAYGWYFVEMFAQAVEKAGADLTADSFVKAVEANPFKDSMFGTPACQFSDKARLCNRAIRLSQIQNQKWVVVKDWVVPGKTN